MLGVDIGIKIDHTPLNSLDPLHLARLRSGTGCKPPDGCVLASAAVRHAAVATFDERLARHAGSS